MTAKISAMDDAALPLTGAEQLEMVQSGASLKATVADIVLNRAKTNVSQTFTGNQATNVTELADAATIAVDASLNNAFKVTITDDRELGNPTNAVEGMAWVVRVTQDATGGRALTFGANYVGPAITDPLDTSGDAADSERLLSFYALSATKIIVVDSLGAAV
jgi:hypothetical protein